MGHYNVLIDTREELNRWVEQASEGDADAYALLVRHYRSRAQAYAYSLTRSMDAAEDVAQDAFIAAFRELPQLRETAAFWSWLRTIVFKHADRWRRANREEVSVPETGLSQEIDALATLHLVEQQFENLNEDEAQVAALSFVFGYSQKEIGDVLGVSVDTVNNRVHAVRKKLKTRLADYIQADLQKTNDDFVERVRLCNACIEGDTLAVRSILSCNPGLVGTTGEVDVEHMRKIACHEGWTPLHLGAHYGHLEIVKLLFGTQADLEAISKNPIRNTPLCAAAFGNRLEIVDWMLRNGAKVDTPNGWGHTALHRAASLGREEMCALLVKHGADRLAQTPEGQTASDLAFAHGFSQLAQHLKQTPPR